MGPNFAKGGVRKFGGWFHWEAAPFGQLLDILRFCSCSALLDFRFFLSFSSPLLGIRPFPPPSRKSVRDCLEMASP